MNAKEYYISYLLDIQKLEVIVYGFSKKKAIVYVSE